MAFGFSEPDPAWTRVRHDVDASAGQFGWCL
jgi:hypothetical protein